MEQRCPGVREERDLYTLSRLQYRLAADHSGATRRALDCSPLMAPGRRTGASSPTLYPLSRRDSHTEMTLDNLTCALHSISGTSYRPSLTREFMFMDVAHNSRLEEALVQVPEKETPSVEVSVVMPCLNEVDTLEACITKAQRALREQNIVGEVIVADNGSTDGSQSLGIRVGARVVHVEAKGYGNALMGGIGAARGRFIIMGDADDSYDFLEIPRLIEKLRQGYDLVQGM